MATWHTRNRLIRPSPENKACRRAAVSKLTGFNADGPFCPALTDGVWPIINFAFAAAGNGGFFGFRVSGKGCER